jgi:hypothetical protein
MPKDGRRSGQETPRLGMMVSSAMRALRDAQTKLNHFLWSSEICYGHLLSQVDAYFSDSEQPIWLTLGQVQSSAWFPNSQGRLKYRETTGRFLEHTQANTTALYRHVLVAYYAHFEDYLTERVIDLRVGNRWGPFIKSLSAPALREAQTPIPARTVLCADICRLIRNLVTHEPKSLLPMDVGDGIIGEWRTNLKAQASRVSWTVTERDLNWAFHQVVGQVANHLRQGRADGKDLPPELFYLLFTFTNLDQLACQIEEATLPENVRLETWISRAADRIRRPDLVVEEDGLAQTAS